MKKSDYEKEKRLLQIELLKMQRWVKANDQKVMIIFEGRDAAGKGGTIKRFMEYINPRGARVVALNKPNDKERGEWYFQRYIQHFPTDGEIVLFDRSWYNRAGVERVMGFCDEKQYVRFLHQAPLLEKMLVESGIHLFKLWFNISREEQIERFEDRREDPLKHWKISPIDEVAVEKWDDYSEAFEDMFLHTHNKISPWHVIEANSKKKARINAMKLVLSQLDYDGKDAEIVGEPDKDIVNAPKV